GECIDGFQVCSVDFQYVPANDVEFDELVRGNDTAFHGDQFAAFGAGFACMTALKIAREDDARVAFVYDLACVDLPQRKIVVPLRSKQLGRSGRIGIVTNATGKTGVKYANIEAARHGGRITGCQVFGYGAFGEAAPVYGDAQFFEVDGFGLARTEDVDSV